MFYTLKIYCVVSLIHVVRCSIDGISYINDVNKLGEKYKKGEDPCNPLYWYPRMRPEYCDQKVELAPRPNLIPLPVPVPAPPPPPPPPPVPIGIPIAPTNPFIPMPGIAITMPMPQPMPPMYMPPSAMPIPMICSAPTSVCPVPAQANPMPAPANSVPVPPYPMPPPAYPIHASSYPMPFPYPNLQYPMPYPVYAPPQPMIGMVPGLPGMVSKDGAINIMPFSDVYADVLEKHRQKVVRKRLENVLEDYESRRQDGRRTLDERSESRRHVTRPAHNFSD